MIQVYLLSRTVESVGNLGDQGNPLESQESSSFLKPSYIFFSTFYKANAVLSTPDLDSWKHRQLLPWSYSAPPAQNQLLNPSQTVSFERLHWQSRGSGCKDAECHQPCRTVLKCFIPFSQDSAAVSKVQELSADLCSREVSRRAILACPTHTTTSRTACPCQCCSNQQRTCEHRSWIRWRLCSRWPGLQTHCLYCPYVLWRSSSEVWQSPYNQQMRACFIAVLGIKQALPFSLGVPILLGSLQIPVSPI